MNAFLLLLDIVTRVCVLLTHGSVFYLFYSFGESMKLHVHKLDKVDDVEIVNR